MVEIMPKSELDLTKFHLTPSWFFTIIIAVVLIAAAIGVGLFLYGKAKALVPSTSAGDF